MTPGNPVIAIGFADDGGGPFGPRPAAETDFTERCGRSWVARRGSARGSGQGSSADRRTVMTATLNWRRRARTLTPDSLRRRQRAGAFHSGRSRSEVSQQELRRRDPAANDAPGSQGVALIRCLSLISACGELPTNGESARSNGRGRGAARRRYGTLIGPGGGLLPGTIPSRVARRTSKGHVLEGAARESTIGRPRSTRSRQGEPIAGRTPARIRPRPSG